MSKSDRRALFIDAEGPNEEALEKALVWLRQLGKQDSEKQDALLAVNTKNQLDGVLSSVIGDGPANELDKKNPVQLGDVEIRLMTKRIDPQGWRSGPILALYPDKKLLDKIDDLYGVTDVLVLPWSKDEVEGWIDTWGATSLTGDTSGTKPAIDDSVVKEAVETLDVFVNTSTGITHPSDRSKCIEIFETLHREGYGFNPATIRAWLVAEKGWSPEDADDVEEIAEGVQAGKSFQYDRGGLADDIVDQWEDRAEDE
ncbi:hypothetical protein [Haloarcula laminariae]|uniref:hypothetical protein n=1 Tax=Haloarcula laminariae TaxID=2961577 RepID=UPI0021C7DA48|nr:hypothetical protein [Halomicroarcula laminariae]